MIKSIKKKFSLKDYKKTIGVKSNIHKVSYFFKKDLNELHNKRLLIIDFEFSMNKIICEVGGLIIENMKVKESIFKEYKLPEGEPYWSFEASSFITDPFNQDKELFSDKDKEWLFKLIDSVDYIVVHNYVAEAQCIALLKGISYNAANCNLIQDKKFICTCYSFKNKYFKEIGIEKTNNNHISEYFGWSIENKKDHYKVINGNLFFKVNKPKGVVSKLHNSYYDSVITLTNLISLKKIID
jgi:hypothetical protein